MIESTLEFATGTAAATKKIAQILPAKELLAEYRRAAATFKHTDIVLILAIKDGEVIAFESRQRADYVNLAFNGAAKKIHPMAQQSAQKRMQLPTEMPAFWLVLELRDRGDVLTCAVGEIRYKTEPASA